MPRPFVTLLVLAAFVSGAVALAAWQLWEPALERGRQVLLHREVVRRSLERHRPDDPLVVLLGDSTLLAGSGTGSGEMGYPGMLARRIKRQAETLFVSLLGGDGFDLYLVSGAVAETDPDVVLLVAHLRALAPAGDGFDYEDLASLIPPGEVGTAAMLPLHEWGMTIPRLLLLRAFRVPALEETATFAVGLRAVGAERAPLRWLVPPEPRGREPGPEERARHFRQYDSPVRRDQPAVRMLEAATSLLVRSGARVLVLVTPIPVERLRDEGLYDTARYRKRIGVLRAMAESNGASLLDFHDALPRDDFVDELGHLSARGARRLADALAPQVRRALRNDARQKGLR